MLFQQIPAGVVATASSIILELVAGLFFKKDQELRLVAREYDAQTTKFREVMTMVDVAETMTTSENRDDMKKQIIRKVVGILPESTAP